MDYRDEVYRLIWDSDAAQTASRAMAARYGIRTAGSDAYVLTNAEGRLRMVTWISMHRDSMPKCFVERFKLWCQSYLNGEIFEVFYRGGLVIVNINSPAPPADASSAIFNHIKERSKVTANGEIRARLKRALTA